MLLVGSTDLALSVWPASLVSVRPFCRLVGSKARSEEKCPWELSELSDVYNVRGEGGDVFDCGQLHAVAVNSQSGWLAGWLLQARQGEGRIIKKRKGRAGWYVLMEMEVGRTKRRSRMSEITRRKSSSLASRGRRRRSVVQPTRPRAA